MYSYWCVNSLILISIPKFSQLCWNKSSNVVKTEFIEHPELHKFILFLLFTTKHYLVLRNNKLKKYAEWTQKLFHASSIELHCGSFGDVTCIKTTSFTRIDNLLTIVNCYHSVVIELVSTHWTIFWGCWKSSLNFFIDFWLKLYNLKLNPKIFVWTLFKTLK